MARVRVLGAGVVGSVYAALLADAGHEVTLIARGSRLVDLRRHGLLVGLDGRILAPDVAVTKSPEVTDCDVLLVAVRGDQLAAALDDIAASPAGWVWMFTNPLELRSDVEDRLSRDRLVWCFSGVGGGVKDGQVTAHRVGQQPTVVEGGAAGSKFASQLLGAIDPHLRTEPDMHAWLDTHTVFVDAMAALVLEQPLETRSQRVRGAVLLVRAMRQAFDSLEAQGARITPRNLRMIFGRVPLPIAALYWAAQLSRPVVQVSMLPHATATRTTEQRAVAAHALDLAGHGPGLYRQLLAPLVGT